MTPREKLIEVLAPAYTATWDDVLDVLFAHRDLLLEALGGTRIAGIDAIVFDSDEAWWRFPVD